MIWHFIIYVPFVYNFKAIDGLILSSDTKNKEVHLVPIQITISKSHSKSEAKFFSDWSNWIVDLMGYKIKTTFLWITESQRSVEELEKKLLEMRNQSHIVNPAYTSLVITLEDVNKDIA